MADVAKQLDKVVQAFLAYRRSVKESEAIIKARKEKAEREKAQGTSSKYTR